eukprot:g20883.t1
MVRIPIKTPWSLYLGLLPSGVNRSVLRAHAAGEEVCELPDWLNMTQLTALNSRQGEASLDGSGTKEPEVALKYIFKFNPLQGYLADGASRCGGWSDWCCVCHAAQWQIACLPQTEKDASKMRKDTSSPGYVADATPLRDSVVMWRPNVGWIELPRSMNASDSYHWMAEYGDESSCPQFAPTELWMSPPLASVASAGSPSVQPTTGDEGPPCTHSFREQLLQCSCPERPGLVVVFKWEQVPMWRLCSPHLPSWDPSSGLSVASETKKAAERISLFDNTEQLIERIAEFMRSVLLCLSTIESEDNRASESPTLPAPKSESSLRVLRAENSPDSKLRASPLALVGYSAQAAIVVVLFFLARLVKGVRPPGDQEERYIQLIEV